MGGWVCGNSVLRLNVQILPNSKASLMGIGAYGSFPFGIGTMGFDRGFLSVTGILAILERKTLGLMRKGTANGKHGESGMPLDSVLVSGWAQPSVLSCSILISRASAVVSRYSLSSFENGSVSCSGCWTLFVLGCDKANFRDGRSSGVVVTSSWSSNGAEILRMVASAGVLGVSMISCSG